MRRNLGTIIFFAFGLGFFALADSAGGAKAAGWAIASGLCMVASAISGAANTLAEADRDD